MSNAINNDTTDNQDNFIEWNILEIGTLKNTNNIGELKYDRKYISSNDRDKSQYIFLKIV